MEDMPHAVKYFGNFSAIGIVLMTVILMVSYTIIMRRKKQL
jgi:hypothetical protein